MTRFELAVMKFFRHIAFVEHKNKTVYNDVKDIGQGSERKINGLFESISKISGRVRRKQHLYRINRRLVHGIKKGRTPFEHPDEPEKPLLTGIDPRHSLHHLSLLPSGPDEVRDRLLRGDRLNNFPGSSECSKGAATRAPL